MAIVKTVETTLHFERAVHIKKALIGFGLVIFVYLILNYFKRIEMGIPLLIAIGYTFYQLNKISIFTYGINGEKKVLKTLEKLSDEYSIYNDIHIEAGDRKAQIDHLVISRYGIWCIETKNMKGKIIGNEDDHEWKQKKVGRKGGVYYKKFYNPCKQNMGHVHVLKDLFEQNGINDTWIQPIVIFTRVWTSSLKIKTKNMPVMKINKLMKYIEEYSQKGNFIDNELIDKIQNIIDNKDEMDKTSVK